MPTTRQKKIYNRKNYITHLYRCRIDSDLADRIAGYKEDGQSLNQLIGELLAEHFGVPLPMKYYTTREVLWRWTPEQEDTGMELTKTTRTASNTECASCSQPFIDIYYALPGGHNVCEDCLQDFVRNVE